MRIGIGAIVGIVGGPATYARSLVRALVALGGHDYVVFTDRPVAFGDVDVETVHVPLRGLWEQVSWDHVVLPRALRRAGVDVYHGTKAVLPVLGGVPSVVTLHDLAPYAMPETFAWPQRMHFRAFVPRSLASARRVIAVSRYTRDDLLRRFPMDPSRVTVVPHGVPEATSSEPSAEDIASFRARHALGDGRLIACVGTIQPRKGVDAVVAAFAETALVDDGWRLVIAGRTRPGYAPRWLAAPPRGVVVVGSVSDADVAALNAASEIAVSASAFEGFGFTVLEAMASGCAVVAIDATSIPEVLGDAGLLVAEPSPAHLGAALRRLAANAAERERLAMLARARARTFTWEATARATRAVYEASIS